MIEIAVILSAINRDWEDMVIIGALLLTFILARDVEHIELLVVGLVASLVLLQIGRLVLQRSIAGLGERQLAWARFFATAVAGILMFQVVARLVASTPTPDANRRQDRAED